MKLVTVKEMKEIELAANQAGMSNEEMMQSAGKGIADFLNEQFSETENKRIIGLIGKGNNGGDTLIALTSLLQSGWNATALTITSRKGESLAKEFIQEGGQLIEYSSGVLPVEIKEFLTSETLILDGLLGTGIHLPLKDEFKEYLKLVGHLLTQDQLVIAVDCPSGIDCDTGEKADEMIPADITLCLEAVKIGLMTESAFSLCGEIYTIPLNLPEAVNTQFNEKNVIDLDWASSHLPVRSEFSHKGTFGKVLVIGGSTNYFGAPMLAGTAAYRSGCGLVTLAVPHAVAVVMANRTPEVTWLNLDDEDGVIAESAADLVLKKANDYTCLAIGPGIGTEETTGHFLEKLLFQKTVNNKRKIGFLEGETPGEVPTDLPTIVIDADALRWLAEFGDWTSRVKADLILTPHPGEMAALTGISIKEIQQDRLNIAAHFAEKWRQVVVLKGALTAIASPDGRKAVIPVASSALAKAGSGDILTGIISSFLAQGLERYEAACLGAWIHANAGLAAVGSVGSQASIMATDIIDCISEVIADLE
jgi:NAD(P)H-hydrate epimerase